MIDRPGRYTIGIRSGGPATGGRLPDRCGARRWLPAILVTILVAAAACGPPRTFQPERPEPIAYADTLPVPKPDVRDRAEAPRVVKNAVVREVSRALSVRRALNREHEAVNVTRLDDVVSSAWFEHRNGTERMTPAEVARGPTTGSGPDTAHPLIVIAGKTEGITPGFTVRDANGVRYLFKFDPKGNLHLGSAAGVISNRLFHAAGYHVPEDYIVTFDSTSLVLDPEAKLSTDRGERPMTADDVRRVLALTDPLPDGRFLAIASKFLPGVPLGPFFFSGTRRDDPNDYYEHEFRRELRGLYVVSAWLNHVDMRFMNTLDVYIEPPGYVRHHLIDFSASLGSGTIRPHVPREGSEYNFDLWPTMGRLVTLGFLEIGWEDREYEAIHPAIGWMPVETYGPGDWKPNWPNPAFNRVTPRDGYWGAKLVASFSDAQLRAAVAAGHLPDPAVEDTLVRILGYRRDRTVAHWYAQVTPIENVEAGSRGSGGERLLPLGFDDLGLKEKIWTAEETRYVWSLTGPGAKRSGVSDAVPGTRQAIHIELPRTAPDERSDGLWKLRVRAERPRVSGRDAIVYLRREGPDAHWRAVGLEH